MSIEITLDRIAMALEQIAKAVHTGVQAPAPVAVLEPAKKSTKKATNAVVAEAAAVSVEEAQDPFSQDEEPKVDFESLTTILKTHAKLLGTKVTVALIVKHGADSVTPKMNTIPEANYKKCYEEAQADIKKVEGKK